MKSDQLTFFEGSTNPLEQLLGKAFFDELPTGPGVYLMYGRSGRLLYVGKAKNLRNRLFTYRRVKSDNSSRKVRRLVRMTTEIEIMRTDSEEAALLKENALIRSHKPEFNHAKKSPKTYYFLTEALAFSAFDAASEKRNVGLYVWSFQRIPHHSQGHRGAASSALFVRT